ncbi:uncharacterized protein LOC106638252 [Copidosoma floridanum]|uniref:uncharacterized protein LOC106638252 n=1 Tax=Copidosoma floridanum TaxID=29053 RepID=UPI0006C9561A|nr:uncharacterized protein LOC106638252 [Copidosoma floridanum]
MQRQKEEAPCAREASKTCSICGDRALGYNFNAVTCESCKAFFRRNALKNKDFRCPFSENCEITPVTRRFCQKCRLDKCFNIGMKKELIMSDEDKALKRRRVEQNRAKKRPSGLDNQNVTKPKRESVDNASFDDTSTSIPSVNSSIASAASEPCFWENEKKCVDRGVKKQPTIIDSMSPATAASVPSSPPESCGIDGTKTLEMLKSSAEQVSGQNFTMDDHSVSYGSLDLNVEKNFSSQIHFDTNSSTLEQNRESPILVKVHEYNTACEQAEKIRLANNCVTSSKCIIGHGTCLSNSSNKPALGEHHMYMTYLDSSSTKLIESCVNQVSSSICQSNIEETIACQGSKDFSTFQKITQNSAVISKLIQSPLVISKIIQDHSLLAKLMTDPGVINKLMSDPQISQLFEQSITDNVQEATKNILINGDVGLVRHTEMLKDKTLEIIRQQVENPILTNLITARNIEEYKNHDSAHVRSEHKKNHGITRNIQREFISANKLESILCEAIKLEYSPYSTLSCVSGSRELNDAERAKLNELIVANKALLAPLEEDITNLVGDNCNIKENPSSKDPKLLGVINLTATAIRRLIKMSKKISAFKNMCQEDQLALLKGGCTEMMILRSAINYDPDKDAWNIPHSQHRMANIKVDVLKEANGTLYDEHKKFIRTFDSRWRDENIVLILSAIALFSPERSKVIHSDVIKLEQNSYYYLLRRYLESVYPGCEAKSNFLKLIQKMLELHRLNKEVVEVYLNVNPSCVEPLLIEIFDLKN